jgi:uncharacterized RDD family membrane protein YckC
MNDTIHMSLRTRTLAAIASLAASLSLALLASTAMAQEQEPAPAPPPAPATEAPAPAPEAAPAAPAAPAENADDEAEEDRHHRGEIVGFAESIKLKKDQTANVVFGFFSSVESEGDVREAVIALFGDARVSGTVGEVAGAIFGNAYVDAHVRGDVFSVFGNVELGPNAEVDGRAVVVGGALNVHPDAVVHGGTEIAALWGLRSWFQNAFMLGRPLAIAPNLEWAWAIALGFLAFYVLLGLMFSSAMERCVATLEERPGETTLASLATVFLTPMAMFILLVTVIGMALIPFLMMALFIAGLFGKAVVLAALGRRITRFAESGVMAHVAFAILIGGLLVTALYLVPFMGFFVQTLTGILGVGVVVYTLLLSIRAQQRTRTETATPHAPVSGGEPIGAAPAAAAAATAYEDEVPPQQQPAGDAAHASAASAAPVDPTTLPRAGFGVRMGALFIDAVLIAILAGMIPGSGDIWLLALASYGAVMWKLKGTTIGGIICNLRVVRLDGQPNDWATAIVRALGCFLSMAAVGLGFFWIAFDRERQGWHDKIAGTVVVRMPKPSSLV